ncbi:MAG: tRNA 2-thiocytidine(32) synthetase TtcA, partial [Mesorhizobium sp.]
MNMLPDAKTLEPIADAAGGFHPLFADVPSSVE